VIIRWVQAGTLLAVSLLASNGCGGATSADLKGVNGKHPDKIKLYVNVDTHPNLVRLCIDHVAFLTSSRDQDAVLRVPEWDAWCGATGGDR
jgi:hypothetical protein